MSNSMAHREVVGYIRNELVLERMVENLYKLAFDTYEASCLDKIVSSSRDVP